MSAPTESGYEWKDAEKVATYLERDENEDEQREVVRAAHAHMISLLPIGRDETFEFLDIGAGAGAVSISVMTAFPNSSGVLADMSEAMMQAGFERLRAFEGRYRYVEYDMLSDDWPKDLAGPFRAVVSARAIHHLPHEQKVVLFKRIRDALVPGGVFLNWDNFPRPEGPKNPDSLHARTVATIDQQVAMLKEAGFEEVSHSHVVARRAVFFGKKAE
jgi:cyclopropane fatty-acyl-phospholipid synthase-like methyltransferase